jgi:hypothetical protein
MGFKLGSLLIALLLLTTFMSLSRACGIAVASRDHSRIFLALNTIWFFPDAPQRQGWRVFVNRATLALAPNRYFLFRQVNVRSTARLQSCAIASTIEGSISWNKQFQDKAKSFLTAVKQVLEK